MKNTSRRNILMTVCDQITTCSMIRVLTSHRDIGDGSRMMVIVHVDLDILLLRCNRLLTKIMELFVFKH